MALQITKRIREGICVLELKGRLVAGEEVGTFRTAIDEASTEEQPKIIACLRDVDYVDSTGLGAMVMVSTKLKRTGGALRLMNVNRRNIELLVLTKLDTMFEIYTDETDAVNSYFPGREIRKFDILSFVQGMKS